MSQVPCCLSVYSPSGAGHWPPLRERPGLARRAREGVGWVSAQGVPGMLSAPPWGAIRSQA